MSKSVSHPVLPDGILFMPKNPYLFIFWRALERKLLVYFMVIWNSFRSFGIVNGHWENFVDNWYIPPPSVLVCLTKKNLATLLSVYVKISPEKWTGRFLAQIAGSLRL
jgi:hypothetical protein